jgi:hypothetical protein
MASSQNQNASYGRALLSMIASQVPAYGDVHVVLPLGDVALASYQNLSVLMQPAEGYVRFWNTLEEAYNAVNSNNNDVIVLGGNGSHTLSASIAWSKNRVHVIGMDGGDHLVQQGAKVQISGSTAAASVITVTGVRNSFRNVKFVQGSTSATALTCVVDQGEGSVYKNCSFVFGVVNNLGGTTAHEFVAGCDSATFINCTFGSDTLLTSAARSVFLIKSGATEFKSNILKDCQFIISSSSASATFIKLNAVTDVLFSNLFINPIFVASVDTAGGIAITDAVQTGTGTTKGTLLLSRPSAFNVTDIASAGSGFNVGVQVVASVSSANANIGIKPTA